MGSIFDLSDDAIASLFSDENVSQLMLGNIGIYCNDNGWFKRAKLMFEESLKMNNNLALKEHPEPILSHS